MYVQMATHDVLTWHTAANAIHNMYDCVWTCAQLSKHMLGHITRDESTSLCVCYTIAPSQRLHRMWHTPFKWQCSEQTQTLYYLPFEFRIQQHFHIHDSWFVLSCVPSSFGLWLINAFALLNWIVLCAKAFASNSTVSEINELNNKSMRYETPVYRWRITCFCPEWINQI